MPVILVPMVSASTLKAVFYGLYLLNPPDLSSAHQPGVRWVGGDRLELLCLTQKS